MKLLSHRLMHKLRKKSDHALLYNLLHDGGYGTREHGCKYASVSFFRAWVCSICMCISLRTRAFTGRRKGLATLSCPNRTQLCVGN